MFTNLTNFAAIVVLGLETNQTNPPVVSDSFHAPAVVATNVVHRGNAPPALPVTPSRETLWRTTVGPSVAHKLQFIWMGQEYEVVHNDPAPTSTVKLKVLWVVDTNAP